MLDGRRSEGIGPIWVSLLHSSLILAQYNSSSPRNTALLNSRVLYDAGPGVQIPSSPVRS